MAATTNPSKTKVPRRATRLARARATERATRPEPPSAVPSRLTKWFADVSLNDVPPVGGKNASPGEIFLGLTPKGVKVPDGIAVTAGGGRYFLREAGLDAKIRDVLKGRDTRNVENLRQRGALVTIWPEDQPPTVVRKAGFQVQHVPGEIEFRATLVL